MSLDVNVIRTLDFLGSKADNSLDIVALDYINSIPIINSQSHLKNDYKNYYFKAKCDAKEAYEEIKLELIKYKMKI